MITLLPGASGSDVNGAMALVGLVSDSAKFKKRLNELVAIVQEARRETEEAKAAQELALVEQERLDGLLAQQKQLAEQVETIRIAVDIKERALNARDNDFAKKEQASRAALEEVKKGQQSEFAQARRDLDERARVLDVQSKQAATSKLEFDAQIRAQSNLLKKQADALASRENQLKTAEALNAAMRKELGDKITLVNSLLEKLKA